jgi:hypothetical protein
MVQLRYGCASLSVTSLALSLSQHGRPGELAILSGQIPKRMQPERERLLNCCDHPPPMGKGLR